MKLESTLVLCDLDALMLGPDGNLTQVLRDVLQLFTARGGRMTVFSQKTPKAVRTILGSVPLSAPALLCGGALVYSFAAGSGQPMGSFAALGDDFLAKLPAAPGIGIALQMKDGATRVVRMNHALERHLRREWTPYLLTQPEGVSCQDVLRVLLYQDAKTIPALQTFEKALEESGAPVRQERLAIDCLALTPGAVSMGAAFSSVCAAAMLSPENVAVLAGRAPGSTPYTLLDHFPKDFLPFIDESHVTVPQVRGMYFGDRARKQTLIDYGFRLPSAFDNRPLNFEEFQGKLNQVIYV